MLDYSLLSTLSQPLSFYPPSQPLSQYSNT
jgi:hypothetical protein